MLQLDLSQLTTPLQNGFYARRLANAVGVERARADAQSLAQELIRRGLSEHGVEIVSRHVAAALRSIEEAARSEVSRQSKARIRSSGGGLFERSLQTLSPTEVALAQAAVRKLAQKLKTRFLRREKALRRGALHVRKTLRRNMAWGGVPMLPQFRKRRPQRPELVILCDLSESVRNASRLMLLFMHSLHELFSRVRSFVFVSDLAEVTEHFRGKSPEQAIDSVLNGGGVSLQSNSNYGRVLATFAREHLGSVSRRSTVMVIGDGRNNYNSANGWALEEMKQRCKRLLWICPEDRKSWGFGDSEMLRYEHFCHQVEVVQTLEDLMRLSDQNIV